MLMKSKLHKSTVTLLKKIFGSNLQEEVNVNKLFSSYPKKNEHYDIVLPAFNIIIECHGEQHRSLQTFGEKDIEKVATNLVRQQHRDKRKEEVAWENGWGYVIIWYDEFPEDEENAILFLKTKIKEAIERIES